MADQMIFFLCYAIPALGITAQFASNAAWGQKTQLFYIILVVLSATGVILTAAFVTFAASLGWLTVVGLAAVWGILIASALFGFLFYGGHVLIRKWRA